MKVALTLHSCADPRAGAYGAVSALSAAMAREGAETRLFTFDDGPHMLRGRLGALAFPWWCAATLGNADFDVIDSSTGDAWLLGAWPHRTSLLVTHSHGLEHVSRDALLAQVARGESRVSWKYPIYTGGFRLFEVRRSLLVADLCLFLNDTDREYAIERLGVAEERAHVLPNGCDDFLLSTMPNLHPPTDGLTVVQLGSYIPRKGISVTASAVTRFLTNHPNARMRFLGTGCTPSRVYEDYPAAVTSRIQVVPIYDRESLPEMLVGSHVLVFPSFSEGFPLALVEGMACGLAPIASYIPGPDQIVREGDDGLYIKSGDADALLDRLERFAADHSLLQHLRRGARMRAEQFRWRNVAKARLALYEEYIERKRLEAH